MRRSIFATGAILAALTATGPTTRLWAADLPSKSAEPEFEAPPPIPVFSWTGAYAGVHAGYAFGQTNGAVSSPLSSASIYESRPAGVIGGAHAGYNVEMPIAINSHAVVTGIEGDIDGANRRSGTPLDGGFAGARLAATSNLQGSIRARLGISNNRLLYYATGGAAFGSFHTTLDGTGLSGVNQVRVGYTLGGGLEYAFTNDYVLRAEYRYDDYATSAGLAPVAAPMAGATVTRHDSDNRLEAGVSYKFGAAVTPPFGN